MFFHVDLGLEGMKLYHDLTNSGNNTGGVSGGGMDGNPHGANAFFDDYYNSRPLPFVIGTAAFQESQFAGLGGDIYFEGKKKAPTMAAVQNQEGVETSSSSSSQVSGWDTSLKKGSHH